MHLSRAIGAIDNVSGTMYNGDMNDFEEAIQDVLDYGMTVIDSLTPEQLEKVMSILGDDNLGR